MKALIAFCFGMFIAVGAVISFEYWCESQLKTKRIRTFDLSNIQSVDELRKLYPDSIFPEPPPPLPPEKRYSGPLFKRILTTHERHHFQGPGLHHKSHRHVIKGEKGEILADVHMAYDKYQRRITPSYEKKRTSRFVAFFGDSNINGFGLSPSQTLAQYLSLKLPEVKVYDYSDMGIYPYQIMERTKNIDRMDEIPEKDGVALYFYFSYHLFRNMGGIHELGQTINRVDKRAVELNEKGEIEIGKPFSEDRPFFYWLAPFLHKSAIVRYFDLELIPQDKDFRVQTAIIKQMRKNLAERGIHKFFVVIHPTQFSLYYAQKLLPYLAEEKIPFIYMGHWKLRQITEGPINLVWDIHVSSETNKVIASGLYDAVREL